MAQEKSPKILNSMKNTNRKVEQRGESEFLVLILGFSFCFVCFLASQVTNLEP